jgi:AcrR family transcriptional regulator
MNDMSTPYHHGALRQALVQATESLLAERGAEGFSLREVARRAGVSPAAPAHHFGDAAGLLTAVASLGFEALTQALRTGEAGGGADARAALRGQGLAYVQFALQHPGRFRLMFRQGKLHADDTLLQHADAAFQVLARGVHRAFGLAEGAAMDERQWNAVAALWSLVHGYAHLAIAGKFEQLGGEAGLQAYVQRSLGPILDATLQGLFGAPEAAPAKPRRRPARS